MKKKVLPFLLLSVVLSSCSITAPVTNLQNPSDKEYAVNIGVESTPVGTEYVEEEDKFLKAITSPPEAEYESYQISVGSDFDYIFGSGAHLIYLTKVEAEKIYIAQEIPGAKASAIINYEYRATTGLVITLPSGDRVKIIKTSPEDNSVYMEAVAEQ